MSNDIARRSCFHDVSLAAIVERPMCCNAAIRRGTSRISIASVLTRGMPAVAMFLSGMIGSAAAVPPQYQFTDLGTLGGNSNGVGSRAWGINDNGQIVGEAATKAGHLHAFLYSDGSMTDLGTLSGVNGTSTALAINNNGDVTGFSPTPLSNGNVFLYSNGVMSDLGGFPASNYGEGHAINNSDQIAGWGFNPGVDVLLYSNDALTDLSAAPGGIQGTAFGINDLGQIVGTGVTTTPNGKQEAWLYQNGTFIDLGDLGSGKGGVATAINNAGQIVGYSGIVITSGDYTHAFLYQGGVMNDLGTFGGHYSEALAINQSGQIVGMSSLPGDTASDPFLYSGGTMYDLTQYAPIPAGWHELEATGINDHGWITGYGYTSTGVAEAFLLKPVPEPSAFILCAVAIMAMAPRLRLSRRGPNAPFIRRI
jgi:probable HAF family extracellular repeat protein